MLMDKTDEDKIDEKYVITICCFVDQNDSYLLKQSQIAHKNIDFAASFFVDMQSYRFICICVCFFGWSERLLFVKTLVYNSWEM